MASIHRTDARARALCNMKKAGIENPMTPQLIKGQYHDSFFKMHWRDKVWQKSYKDGN